MQLLVKGTNGRLQGDLRVPASKYHAHRALILASLARGTSRIVGLSDAQHVKYTMRVLRALGTSMRVHGDAVIVEGGEYAVQSPSVSAGSSGSTLYFMMGLASLADVPLVLTAQRYFQRRPIVPLLDALARLGVRLESANGCPPITVWPVRPRGGEVTISGTLSQWISGLLLLAPFARERTTILVDGELNERPYVRLTVEMMRAFGLEVRHTPDWRRFDIEPGQSAQPATYVLPPDVSSAAFGLAAAAIHPADIRFLGLSFDDASGVDHPEAAFLEIVRSMGVPLTRDSSTGALAIRHDGAPLRPVRVDCRDVPDMLPVLSALATFARGESRLENVAHVRLKESDRVVAMLQLNRMGGALEMRGDSLAIRGVDRLVGAQLSSFNDHRVLMGLAIAASRANGQSALTYPHAYRISYPLFFDAMRSIGISMTVANVHARDGRQLTTSPDAPSPDVAASLTLDELLRLHAENTPREPAVIEAGEERDRVLTWRELDDRVQATAALLYDLGVRGGERVAFVLPNCLEFVVVSLAILRVGATCTPLMPIFRERELDFCLRRSGARVLVIPERWRGRSYPDEIASLCASSASWSGQPALRLEHVLVVSMDRSQAQPLPEDANGPHWQRFALKPATPAQAERKFEAASSEAIAQMLFTSGTTGEPKGVLHRSDVLMRAAAMEIEHLGLRASDDRIYVPSPLAHQTGFLYGMWLALVLGSAQIVQPTWNPIRALRVLDDWNGTFVQAATPFLADIVKEVEAGVRPPAALRIFVATGAAVPRGLAERATRLLGTAVCGAWGTTESCLGTLAAPADEPAKVWGTDGRALRGIRLRIVDDDGNALPPGSEGHFQLHSPTMFEGYADRPEWTEDSFTSDGWFKTGDLAVMDESGFMRITGRVRDVINRGGEKIPVAEIEQLLGDHPAVADVAIVAMPDERLGERACAFVVRRGGTPFDFGAMQRYLDACRVAKPYWPERLEFVGDLPRTPAGKIRKYVLRERAKSLRPQTSSKEAVSWNSVVALPLPTQTRSHS